MNTIHGTNNLKLGHTPKASKLWTMNKYQCIKLSKHFDKSIAAFTQSRSKYLIAEVLYVQELCHKPQPQFHAMLQLMQPHSDDRSEWATLN